MLTGLLMMSGHLILALIYGEKGLKRRNFGFRLPLLLSLIFIFWLMTIIFLFAGISAKDTILCIIIAIGVPVGITFWSITARRKINQEIENEIENL